MKNTEHPYRVALYFAPLPDSPWWNAGSQWLGRCALRGEALPQPEIPGVDAATFRALTKDPRRYGWHATLKPPFRLVQGTDLRHVREALHGLCAEIPPFTLPPLRPTLLDDFIALQPEGGSPRIDALAAACVTRLHALAAPLTPAEVDRRRQMGLDPREDELLQQWGYPWVLENFRFHMSLTGRLGATPAEQRDELLDAAGRHFAGLPDCEVRSVAMFVEREAGAPFQLLEHVELRT